MIPVYAMGLYMILYMTVYVYDFGDSFVISVVTVLAV